MQPLFLYKFSVNPLFLQNTRGKFLKYFFEEQDTALLLLGIGFILFFCFTIQFFLGMTPVRACWAATWCPTLEAWCNVVAYTLEVWCNVHVVATCTEILHFEHSLTSYVTIFIKYYNKL